MGLLHVFMQSSHVVNGSCDSGNLAFPLPCLASPPNSPSLPSSLSLLPLSFLNPIKPFISLNQSLQPMYLTACIHSELPSAGESGHFPNLLPSHTPQESNWMEIDVSVMVIQVSVRIKDRSEGRYPPCRPNPIRVALVEGLNWSCRSRTPAGLRTESDGWLCCGYFRV